MTLSGVFMIPGCMNTMQDSKNSSPVYPMYLDENNDGINDFVQLENHYPGKDTPQLLKATATSAPVYTGHEFRDENNDGICDYAQNGGNYWHGPGFTDGNTNGVCDYWETGNAVHNRHEGMMYIDSNSNNINDYYESTTHQGGNHEFIDLNNDGICDRAQDGGVSWHGPGYVDADDNETCDYWQPGSRGYDTMHHHM